MWNLGLTVALGATLVAAGYSGGSYNPSGSGTLPNMGRCNSWIRSDPSADYEQFASERVWVFRKVPDSSFTRTLEWMYLQVEPQPYPLVWNGTIHYQLNNGSTGAFKNNIVYDHGGGHITLYDTDGIYSEAFFLIIIPNRLAFYYICSNIGGDYTTDYRYLATRPGVKLTPQEYSYFQKVETSSRFKNNLIDLPSSGPDLGVLHQSSNTNFCGQ